MRTHLLGATFVVVAACSAPSALPLLSASAMVERQASAETTLPPEFRAAVGWTRFPAQIAARSEGGPCGQAPRQTVASRIDPAVELSPGRWRFNGCIYAEGTSFTKVFIEISFPDGTKLRSPVADKTPPDKEYSYEVVVLRADVLGATAQLYAVNP